MCTGVEVINPATGEELSLTAKYEVIVSQGVFESPKLLMLSGIGPASEFKQHGIPVIVDSRHVGQNLLDHPIVPFVQAKHTTEPSTPTVVTSPAL